MQIDLKTVAEQLRGSLVELQVANVCTHPTLSLFQVSRIQFSNPDKMYICSVHEMLDQLNSWSAAFQRQYA